MGLGSILYSDSGTPLLEIVEEKTKIKPTPQDPISPLGEKLFNISN